MDSLTLDQLQIFLAIVDEGSFSKAAKRLNRAQSAVTYGIQKLEAQFDLPLFDRSAYRPELTEAGRTLLMRARRVAEEANAFRDTAHSLASGLEAELTIVLDSMFHFGWDIAKLPSPWDQYAWIILSSFIIVSPVAPVLSATSAWLGRL